MSNETATGTDERVNEMSSFRNALIRPELGGIIGTIAVFAVFIFLAGDSGMFSVQGVMNWSVVSAQFMIIAVGACLLMIAGEFDLSVGSMIGFAGMLIAIFGVTFGWPMWMAIILTFVICMTIGALNGLICIRTGLPSFIVTLAFLFILRGSQSSYLKQLSAKPSSVAFVKRQREIGSALFLAAKFYKASLFIWVT